MIRCERCDGIKITATAKGNPIRDAMEYMMNCEECDYKWSQRLYLGTTREDWRNVRFLRNPLWIL